MLIKILYVQRVIICFTAVMIKNILLFTRSSNNVVISYVNTTNTCCVKTYIAVEEQGLDNCVFEHVFE